jgi:hypothetical protein
MKNIIVLLILLLPSHIFSQTEEWLTIGIVRTDGIIAPTFRYENNQWKKIYGQKDEFRFYEGFLRKWYFVPFDKDPYYLNVGSLVEYDPDSDISSGYGYLSDYPRINLTRHIFPIEKVGICLSKEYPITLFHTIEDSSKVWKEIFNLVSPRKIEIDTHFMKPENWNKYFGEDHIVDFKNINLRGTVLDSLGIYYFEVYYPFGQNECKSVIYCSGWVVNNSNKYKILNDFIGFDDCDSKMLSNIPVTPLFVIKMNNELYIHLINHSWEGEDYGLWKISQDKIEKMEFYID